jgi:hypothetical protein
MIAKIFAQVGLNKAGTCINVNGKQYGRCNGNGSSGGGNVVRGIQNRGGHQNVWSQTNGDDQDIQQYAGATYYTYATDNNPMSQDPIPPPVSTRPPKVKRPHITNDQDPTPTTPRFLGPPVRQPPTPRPRPDPTPGWPPRPDPRPGPGFPPHPDPRPRPDQHPGPFPHRPFPGYPTRRYPSFRRIIYIPRVRRYAPHFKIYFGDYIILGGSGVEPDPYIIHDKSGDEFRVWQDGSGVHIDSPDNEPVRSSLKSFIFKYLFQPLGVMGQGPLLGSYYGGMNEEDCGG